MLSITAPNGFYEDKQQFVGYDFGFRCGQEGLYWPQDYAFPMLPNEIMATDFDTLGPVPMAQEADFVPLIQNTDPDPRTVQLTHSLPQLHRSAPYLHACI
jgi:hypothetical protein